ncbi:hypothetical protein [Gryllotalpicola protaetiae]|uniref:hypothetical protein n=1 Tax=Gryllotalpicola protaetiae TaxID=2419771 RepID=UPI0013C4D7CC|nr:hypothetical protein [Gryllotalpicola protaetiae]
MTRYDNTIELPVDAAEAVKALQRELSAAKNRLAQSRHDAAFGAYRVRPPWPDVSGRS